MTLLRVLFRILLWTVALVTMWVVMYVAFVYESPEEIAQRHAREHCECRR
jgi:hypothetical protein